MNELWILPRPIYDPGTVSIIRRNSIHIAQCRLHDFWGKMKHCLFPPESTVITDQTVKSTQTYCTEPVTFLGSFTGRSVGKKLQ